MIPGYWTVAGSCISAWTTGSTLLAFGLNPRQAIGCVVCLSLAVHGAKCSQVKGRWRYNHGSFSRGLWVDGWEAPYWLYRRLSILVGHAGILL